MTRSLTRPCRRAIPAIGVLATLFFLVGACSSTGPGEPDAQIASVTISPDTLRVLAGGQGRLGVSVRDAAGGVVRGTPVFWSVADTTIATVDQEGLVRGVRPGSVQVSASASGHSDVADVVVQSAGAAAVTVDPPTASVLVGSTTQLGATVRDAGGTVITDRPPLWSSSNSAVATVNQQGLVSGVSPGTTTIVAALDGRTGSATVTVTRVPVASVVITPAETEVRLGRTVKLVATAYDAQGNVLAGRSIAWSSSSTTRATVDQTGTVTGRTLGIVTISATSEGQTGTAKVTVRS
jgi:uncharacterized protein YjdB